MQSQHPVSDPHCANFVEFTAYIGGGKQIAFDPTWCHIINIHVHSHQLTIHITIRPILWAPDFSKKEILFKYFLEILCNIYKKRQITQISFCCIGNKQRL